MTLLVVKLGGSHAGSPVSLRGWLQAIAQAAGDIVLVPGGGPFADAVRAAQGPMGFDDSAAHDMALLAMAQFGRALCSLDPALVMAHSKPAIRAALAAGRVPVWSPWPMLDGAADIPQSWDVTSDSLALWLAQLLGAARVLLVKHCAPSAAGVVDAAFPRFRAAFAGTVDIAGPDDHPARALRAPSPAWRETEGPVAQRWESEGQAPPCL